MTDSLDTARSAAVVVRRATMADVDAIHRLITYHAELDRMLFRSYSRLYEHLRDFFVAYREAGGAHEVVGCVALELIWRDLAEIKSLAVDDHSRGQGIGRDMVEAAVAEARTLKLQRVFALTREAPFFFRLGFREVPKASLPHKVWTDCVSCPVRDNCDEVAVVLDC